MKLEHGMNCGALGFDGYDAGECTCGLEWRIRLQTEQEMHAAWRKRAEEAEKRANDVEAKLALLNSFYASDAEENEEEKLARATMRTVELACAANNLIDYCEAHNWGTIPIPFASINPLLKLLGRAQYPGTPAAPAPEGKQGKQP